MLDYEKIKELFGTPLDKVQRPHIPYKFKFWHLVAGGAFAYLAFVGGKHLYEKHIKQPLPKVKKPKTDLE